MWQEVSSIVSFLVHATTCITTTRQKHFICNQRNLPGHSANFHLPWKLSHTFTYNLSANANVFHKVKQIKLPCVTMHVHTRMRIHIQIHKSHTLSIKHYVSRQNNHIYSPPKQFWQTAH